MTFKNFGFEEAEGFSIPFTITSVKRSNGRPIASMGRSINTHNQLNISWTVAAAKALYFIMR